MLHHATLGKRNYILVHLWKYKSKSMNIKMKEHSVKFPYPEPAKGFPEISKNSRNYKEKVLDEVYF